MKRAKTICLGLLIIAVAAMGASAQQPSAQLRAKSVNAAAILAKAAAQSRARIIVQYKIPAGPGRASLGTDRENMPAIISENHAAQDAVLTTHFGQPSRWSGPDRSLRRMSISPAFAINATVSEIEALAADERVVSIDLDQIGNPQLAQSVPLIGMNVAYGTYNATGSGWAVAVLDTGVEKSHTFITTGKTIAEACFSTTTGTLGSGGSASLCPSYPQTIVACPDRPGFQAGGVAAQNLLVGGGQPTSGYSWSVTSGFTLPSGIVLDPLTGVIHGDGIPSHIPPAGSNLDIPITVTDQIQTIRSTPGSITLSVQSPGAGNPCGLPIFQVLAGPIPLLAEQNVPYAVTLSVVGGTPAFTWSLASGSLPAGLVLDQATGVVRGTPTGVQPGQTFNFSVNVTDSTSASALVLNSYSLTVCGLPDLPCPGTALQFPPGDAAQAGAGINCDITWDGCQHGTHVAGIAVGLNSQQQTGQPPNGVGKNASLIAIKMYSEFTGADCPNVSPCVRFWFSDLQAALDHVFSIRDSLPGGVKVAAVNLSGGGGHFSGNCDSASGSPALKTSIDTLRSAGIPTIIAAGNGFSTSQIGQPACISTAIAVASSSKSDVVSSFSDLSTQVALFAPGGEFPLPATNPILASVPAGFNAASFGFSCNYTGTVPSTGGSYCGLQGTSMAAPHVAGAFAAIRTACPTKTVDQILNALISTGTAISDTRPGGTVTKNRIRVDLALQQLACVTPNLTLVVGPAANIASSGNQGGPFSPSSFQYQLSASTGSVDYAITGTPSWLTPSSTSGTVTTSPTTITFTVNATANSLAAGTYGPTTITFTNTTNGQGNTTRTATLTVLPTLQVSPASNIASAGNQGGPFTPSSFQYQLSASSGSVNYSITGTPSWLTPSSTSGTLTTSPTTITFTVNASANGLAAGTYGPTTITFTNTTNGQGNTTRTATLTVSPAGTPTLQVSPGTNIESSGNQGGPFSPSSFQYQLSASTGSVNYSITGTPSWLTPSSTSGTLTTSPTTITFSVNASANGLAAGTYGPTTITFTNTTNGQGTTTRTATLTVSPAGTPTLQISSPAMIVAAGTQGGPFSPSSFQYQLSASTGSVNYSITGTPSWLTPSSTSGTLTTSPTTITFSVNASANGLAAGTYGPITITFTNTTNGQGTQSRGATLTVNPPLTLVVSPTTAVTASGPPGGPFSPASFHYQVSTTSGSLNFSISSDQPGVFTIVPSSGTATTTPTDITFTLNQAQLASLPPGVYVATQTFTNTTNGQGSTTRTATLGVNAPGAPSNDHFANAFPIHLGQVKLGTNAAATKEAGEPNHAGNAGGRSMWWNYLAVSSGPVLIRTLGSNFDTLLAVYTGNSVNALTLVASNDDANFPSDFTSAVTFNAVAGTIYRIAVDGYNPGSGAANGNIQIAVLDNTAPATTSIVASLGPNSRATTVNQVVTAYFAIINGGAVTATACSAALPPGVPATFDYQVLGANGQPTGTPNTPVDIGAGQAKFFYFAITPTQAMSQEIAIIFQCTNTNPAPVFPGINTFSLTAGQSVADLLMSSAAAVIGIMDLQTPTSAGFFAAVALNIGPSATITFVPTDHAIGQLPENLPLTKLICQVNPNNGQCINPATPGPSTTVTVGTNEAVYFGVFVTGQGTYIPFDIPNNRVFVIANQGNVQLSAASVAVRMLSGGPAAVPAGLPARTAAAK